MITFRSIHKNDREPMQRVLRATKHFTEQEIDIALELADEVINQTDLGYHFVVAEDENNHFIGYGCWGKVPLTSATYDIYWIAVTPDGQGQGVGTRILQVMEKEIQADKGQLILIETSSSNGYQDTRAFYEKRGYDPESRIRDFYKPGDDRIIFTKRFEPFG